MNQVELAEQIAREVHKGQRRTLGRREDYIKHPERVASHFSTDESKIIAWLHDVIEDSKLLPQDLRDRGIDTNLVYIVTVLTKDEDETYLDYILRVKEIEQARIIKIADIRDNLEKLNKGSLRDKYIMALHILEN
jgi:(p)ppGpp synthase/HD superfamily hydrolase